ncbi:MAG: glycosyltransferase family 9 protein [Thermodesulfobacteriota bacterium]
MRILIIKLSSIGDVVHTLPSLYALKELLPDSQVDWLVEEEAHDLLCCHPMIDKLWISKRKRWLNDPLNGEGLKGMYHLIKGIRERRYDLVIDFQGLFKSGMAAFLSGGKVRLGYDKVREFSHYFLNDRLSPFDPEIHAVDRYLNIVKSLGWKGEEAKFVIPIDDDNRERVKGLLRSQGLAHIERIILVSPKARWETKLWGKAKFAGLCDKLIENFKREVVILGGKADREYIRGIISLMKNRAIDLSGQTDLRELACLMSLSPLAVCVDSGPMHIADAVSSRVIALFGPTSPRRTGPYGKGHIIVRKKLPCSPCFLRDCKNVRCMREILVDEVLEAVNAVCSVSARLRLPISPIKSSLKAGNIE